MLDLSSSKDLIRSLILKALGKPVFKFIHDNTGWVKHNTIEFITENYKFSLIGSEDKIRVYDNGNVFFICRNDKSELEYVFISLTFHELMKEFAEKLQDFYNLEIYTDKINKDLEVEVYKFVKLELT